MAEKKDSGFQSGAGLIRYFDEEEINGPSIDPKLVIILAGVTAFIIEILKLAWPIIP